MIDQLNDALRTLLLRELPVKTNELDIVFQQPRREWSVRLSRPTLNIFLHDIRENGKLRGQQPAWNTAINGHVATLSRQPRSIDLHYMITAWTTYPADEHRLLMRVLTIFMRYGELPGNILKQHFRTQQENGIPFKVAQYDMHINPRDLWSVLDNEMRASIDLMATITVNPTADVELPLVREVETTYHQIITAEENPNG